MVNENGLIKSENLNWNKASKPTQASTHVHWVKK